MKKIAFVLKGTTFLRALGPLIYFSKKCSIEPVVVFYKERRGKQYDSINPVQLVQLFPNIILREANDDKHVINLLHDCDAVVGQDIHWHFPFVVGKLPTFSIALFFDTLHYITTHQGANHSVPTKTYFASDYFADRFHGLAGEVWPCAIMDSPTFDHSLFAVKDENLPESVLFLSPPQNSVTNEVKSSINELIDYCFKHNILFVLKDRIKSPWSSADGS